jgi:cobalt-zinc-cadmium efflux system membrane fusion protein
MKTRSLVPIFALVLLTAGVRCTESNPAGVTAVAPAGADGQHGAGAEAGRPSDLDRPVAQLVGLTCEHRKRTFECDDCRYEVGFVRAPSTLTEGGLITTVRAERRQVAVPIALTGEIRFDERRIGHVSSQVEGVIRKVHVALGEPVVAGQALLEIESVAVGEAQAIRLETRAMLDLARQNFERASGLHEAKITSEREYLQARHELEAAGIRARGARDRLRRLGSGGVASGRLTLRAPMDGAVLVLHAVPGGVAGTEESLVTVGDNSTLRVWADLYERDIAAVQAGHATHKLAATVSVKAYPGEIFPGTVDLVGPAMDESSRTAKVRIEVGNTDGRLLAGMFAAVQLFLPGTDEALVLPRQAVLEDEGRTFVFVHHQGEYYVRRPVVPGRTWAGWVEIEEGLEPSQIVVAEGAFLMKSDVLRSKMGAGCAD